MKRIVYAITILVLIVWGSWVSIALNAANQSEYFRIVKVISGSVTLDNDYESGYAGIIHAVEHGMDFVPAISGGVRFGGITSTPEQQTYLPFGTAGVVFSSSAGALLYGQGYEWESTYDQPNYAVAWADSTYVYMKFITNWGTAVGNYRIYIIDEIVSNED